MSRPTDIETRLRTSLAAQSHNAPPGGPLAERILAELDAPSGLLRPRGGWRTWTFPLLAAAAVAAVVTALVGVSHLHNRRASGSAASLHAVHPLPTAPSVPSLPHSTRYQLPLITTAPVASGALFRATDLTFVSPTSGWALGTVSCATGRCTTLYRTTDGHTWTQMRARLPFDVEHVKHLRFADDNIGYAFGPDALFMTTDGGAHWTRQPGGAALALESHDGIAIRLTTDIETSPIGSTEWTVALPDPGASSFGPPQLVRAGRDAYVLAPANPAGGGESERSELFRSSDDGATWIRSGEPCPQGRSEVDSVSIAAAPGRASVLCQRRFSAGPTRLAVSTDDGRTFHTAAGAIPGSPSGLVGNPDTELVAYGNDGAYRSTDAGASWQRIAQLRRTVSFLGFESSTVGRALTDGGRSVWTTHDGGATWQRVVFR